MCFYYKIYEANNFIYLFLGGDLASSFNVKSVHRDGKAELKIGIDSNTKILDGIGDYLLVKNEDGTPAKISNVNIIGMPENVSESNKLVTQADLKEMMKKVNSALESTNETISALKELASIVGGF